MKLDMVVIIIIIIIIGTGPRRRWEDNIKMDLQEVGRGCGDWMELAQDRDRWRALVSNELWGSIKWGNFLISCKTS